jgi:hypothetical protein
MISKSFLLFLLCPVTTIAFRPPENPASVNLSTVIKPRADLAPRPTSTVTTTKSNDGLSPVTEISSDALVQVGRTVAAQKDATYHAQVRKRWGIDNAEENEYWYDSRIHTLGNAGFLGAVHAALAPLSTKIIDVVAYDGRDIRSLVS